MIASFSRIFALVVSEWLFSTLREARPSHWSHPALISGDTGANVMQIIHGWDNYVFNTRTNPKSPSSYYKGGVLWPSSAQSPPTHITMIILVLYKTRYNLYNYPVFCFHRAARFSSSWSPAPASAPPSSPRSSPRCYRLALLSPQGAEGQEWEGAGPEQE